VVGGGVKMSELPDWTLPYYSENYTGPWLSDGKIQESVANGKSKPKSKLDALSRKHDTAYAVYKDRKHRYQADLAFQRGTEQIGGFVPRAAGYAVRYLNQFGDGRTLRDTSGNFRGSLKGGGGEKYKKDKMNPYSVWDVGPISNAGGPVGNVDLPDLYSFRGSVPKRVTQPSEPVPDPYDSCVAKPEFKFEKANKDRGSLVVDQPQYHVNFRRKVRRRRRKLNK